MKTAFSSSFNPAASSMGATPLSTRASGTLSGPSALYLRTVRRTQSGLRLQKSAINSGERPIFFCRIAIQRIRSSGSAAASARSRSGSSERWASTFQIIDIRHPTRRISGRIVQPIRFFKIWN